MTSRDFCYWLQGYFELSGTTTLDAKQSELVKKHLHMVFYHEIDPSFGKDKQTLDKIHGGLSDLVLPTGGKETRINC